jgi:hypothetical protein
VNADSRKRWRRRGQELKRIVWRRAASTLWGPLFIAVGAIPVGLVGVIFAPGDFDRLGSALLLGLGLAVLLGLIRYLDWRIERD